MDFSKFKIHDWLMVGGGAAMLILGFALDWTSIDTGTFHSCGIRTDRSLWCWGGNDDGQLGDGTTTGSTSPVEIGSGNRC